MLYFSIQYFLFYDFYINIELSPFFYTYISRTKYFISYMKDEELHMANKNKTDIPFESYVMDISYYIPVGREKAVSRKDLMKVTGLPDRVIRRMISESAEPIINIGDGYFIPDVTNENDMDFLRKYVQMENNRIHRLQVKMQKFEDYII